MTATSAVSFQSATETILPCFPLIRKFLTFESLPLRFRNVLVGKTETTVPVTTGVNPGSTSSASIFNTSMGGMNETSAVSDAVYSTSPSSSLRMTPLMDTDAPTSMSAKISGIQVIMRAVPDVSPTSNV